MRRPALLGLILLLSGCVSTTRTLDVSDAASRQAISERAGRQRALVTVRGEQPVPADGLRIDADSTSWTDRASGAVRSVSTRDVDRVSFSRADPEGRIDALTGLVVGAAAGAVAGAILGLQAGTNIVFDQTANVTMGAFTLGLLGAGTGALVSAGPIPERFVLAPPDSTAPPR